MKSKAPLVMMEQIVMVLIFALAAALCLQTFVLSGRISQKTEAKNRALVEVQNVAEILKTGGLNEFMEYYGPEQTGGSWNSYFSEDWALTQEESLAEYILNVSFTESQELSLWQAEITMAVAKGEELVSIPAAGQTEVMQNE